MTLEYDVNDLTNRSRTSVTALLVLVTLFGSITNKSDFPKTSGFKHIDVWFVWFLINIFLIICHHTAISKIENSNITSVSSTNQHTAGFDNMNKEGTSELEHFTKRKELINRTMSVILFLSTFLFNVVYFSLAESLI